MEWITTQDLSAEAWRRILEYANIDITTEAIIARHGVPTSSSQKQDYKKQAMQVRVAILQAQEYFAAVRSSSLFTSPNHLYYGMISLASAIMLIRGSGEKALDRLREKSRNRHHGFEFTTTVTQATCNIGLSILENSVVRLLDRGHFVNWYSTLPRREMAYAIARSHDGSTVRKRRVQVGSENTVLPDELVQNKYDVLSLVKRLPDMHNDLKRYGVHVPSSRVNVEFESDLKSGKQKCIWRIHEAPSPSHLEMILESFQSPARFASNWSCTDYFSEQGCIATFEYADELPIFQCPSLREDLNNEQITYAFPLDTHEIVDAYMISYALSMLARYYPDYWIGCLDSHCKAAKVIDRLVFVLALKFPVMALKLLVSDDIVISTHKPPWY